MAERAIDAVILAGGKGTRMKSDLPKVLHKVCGRTMIDWVLDACDAIGTRRNIVVVGYRQDLIREALKERTNCHFVVQEEQLGTGHAALQAAPLFTEGAEGADVFVLCGDGPLIHAKTLKRLLDTHRGSGALGSIATAVVDDATGYGRIVRNESGGFERIVEQKDATPEEQAIKEVNPSYYCFQAKSVFEQLPLVTNNNVKGEYYLTDVMGMMKQLKEGGVAVVTSVPKEDILGVNTLEDLAVVEEVMKQRLPAGGQ